MIDTEKKTQADAIIREHVLWSIGVGLLPVPVLDIVAVSAVQMDLLQQLAHLYEVDYSEANGKLFVSAVTGGLLAKSGATVIKRVPIVGALFGGVSMAITAGASTYAVGNVAVGVFESDGDLAAAAENAADNAYQEIFERGKEFVARLTHGDLVAAAERAVDGAYQEIAERSKEFVARLTQSWSSNGKYADIIQAIERLQNLMNHGAISGSEFETQKRKLLKRL